MAYCPFLRFESPNFNIQIDIALAHADARKMDDSSGEIAA